MPRGVRGREEERFRNGGILSVRHAVVPTLRGLVACVLACAALAVSCAHAQSPAGTVIPGPDAPPKEAALAAPAGPPPAVAEPSSVIEARPIATTQSAPPSVLQQFTVERLLDDVKITDVAIAFFALVVALFALRVGSAVKRVGRAVQGQHEDSRRAIEAAERAAESARRSAEAAEQTLTTMRDPAERQLRAYVTVKQFLQAPAKDDRENIRGWFLQVAWQNSGATPTQSFRYWAMLREFDGAVPDDFEFTPQGLKDFAGGELSSGATINSPPLYVSPELIEAIQSAGRKVLLLGQADYTDVLGNNVKRETRFCVEVVLLKDPSGAEGLPFSFIYHPQHNYVT